MKGDLQAAKQRLRQRLGACLRVVSPQEARSTAEACARHLLAAPGLAAARRVALYAALPDEVPTLPLFEALGERRIERLLPRIEGSALRFAPLARWEALEPGPFGVAQPPADAPATVLGPGDWVIVPGVAFDRRGWRLGRGGGHYDRALAAAPGVMAVGVAHGFQIVDRVPHDSHDRPVDAIVTEDGWSRARDS